MASPPSQTTDDTQARAELLLSAIADLHPELGFALFDDGLRFVQARVMPSLQTGRAPGDYVGRTAHEVYAPPLRERMVAAFRAALAGTTQVFDVAFGGRILEVRCGPVPGAGASPALGFATAEDVTERRRAVEALQESEERYRLLADNASDVVWTMGPTGSITYVSPAVEVLRGFTVAEAMCQPLDQIHPPESAAVSARYFTGLIADTQAGRRTEPFRGELEYRCKDGSTIWTEVRAFPIYGPDGAFHQLLGVSRDISARKDAEEALRRSELRFRTLADASPVGIFEADANGTNVYLNPAAIRILGQSVEQTAGRGWQEAIHPDDRERVQREWREAIAERRHSSTEHRVRRPDGKVVIVRAYADVVRNPAGEVTGFVGVLLDVTEQRQAEQQLAVASRLAALGTLVAGVAHEVNNPLTAVIAGLGSVAEAVYRSLQDLERGEVPAREALIAAGREELELLADATEGAARIAKIVKDLSIFGSERETRQRIRMAEVVHGALRWLPASVPAQASITVEQLDAPDVSISRGQVEQIVVNLITNAARATTPGTRGEILVRTGTGAGGTARLEVIDRGIGMSAETLGKIFTPFFTTRPAGDMRGTGLGLAICHAIVSEHGGRIFVATEPGKGSTFTVELPPAPLEASQ